MAAEELEAAEFDWGFDNTSQLINLYETFPCLYDVRSKDHKNRDMRDKALEQRVNKSLLVQVIVCHAVCRLLPCGFQEEASFLNDTRFNNVQHLLINKS